MPAQPLSHSNRQRDIPTSMTGLESPTILRHGYARSGGLGSRPRPPACALSAFWTPASSSPSWIKRAASNSPRLRRAPSWSLPRGGPYCAPSYSIR